MDSTRDIISQSSCRITAFFLDWHRPVACFPVADHLSSRSALAIGCRLRFLLRVRYDYSCFGCTVCIWKLLYLVSEVSLKIFAKTSFFFLFLLFNVGPEEDSTKSRLGAGAIAGIVIGVIVLFIICLVLFCCRHRLKAICNNNGGASKDNCKYVILSHSTFQLPCKKKVPTLPAAHLNRKVFKVI